MKNIFLTILGVSISFLTFSQTYNIATENGNTISTCSGTFVDEGGSGGDYVRNADQTITFCPSTPGDIIRITFTSFAVRENNGQSRTCQDVLDVYQGNMAYYTANSGNPEDRYCGTLTGAQLPVVTSTSPDGCITFNFLSDNSQQLAGWTANISCVTPCSNPTADLTDVSDVSICPNTATNGGIIGNTGNYSVSFDATTSSIGSYVTASHNIISYNWDFGDGTTTTTATATTSHNYTTPGVYKATVSVVDDNTDVVAAGCASTNAVVREVTVMPTPDITDLGGSTTCGNCVDLNATATSQTAAETLPTITVSPTNLPDGNGTCYTSTVDYGGFFNNGATVSAGCYPNLCFDISHSWARDLIITLIAPDGRRVRVYNRQYPTDETVPYFGDCTNPTDGDADGCPRTYCVSTNGSGTNWTAAGTTSDNPSACAAEATCETGVGGEYYLAGTYNSFDPFSNLDGAPLNGVWTLEVCDNQSLDDGTLHSWSLDFPAACLKTLSEVTPDISTITWTPGMGAPAVSSNNCTSTAVFAPGPDACPPGETCEGNERNCDANVCVPAGVFGNFIYDYVVTDEYGCQHDGDVTLSASCACAATATLSLVGNNSFCLGDSTQIRFNFTGTGPYNITYTDGTTNFTENGIVDGATFYVGPTTSTTYSIVSFTDVGLACNGTFSGTVDLTVNPLPVVTANASDVEICIGDSVLLTGSGANTYTWDNGVIDGDSVGPTVQTTYTVTGEDGNGCIDTNSVTIDVNSLPNVVANASSSSICPGDSVRLTGSGASTYTWDNGVTNGDSVSPGVQTTYTVTGQDVNGCINTDQVIVSIFTLPNVVANASATNICIGDSVRLTGGGANTYVWDNGVIDGDSVGPITNTTYTVIGTDNNGCENTDQVAISITPTDDPSFAYSSNTFCLTGTDPDTISTGTPGGIFSSDNGLTIDANSGTIDLSTGVGNYNVIYTTQGTCPASSTQQVSITTSPTATFSYGSATYCPVGIDTVTFAANASGGVFSSTAGLSINSSTGEIDLLNSTPGTYTVSNDIAASGGCAAANATFDIEIFSLPVVTANASDVEICIGDSVLLTGSGANTYTWDNGVIDGDSVGPTVQTTYTVTGEDGNGCIDTNSVTIDVNSLPNVVANASSSSICPGDSVRLTGSGASTYTWDNGVTNGDSVSPGVQTTYTVTGQDVNGCINTDQVIVSIFTLPNVVANASATNICIGDSVRLTGGGANTYVWDNGVIDGDSVGPITNTTYTVIGTDNNGCENTDQVAISITPTDDPSFAYSSNTFCLTGTDPDTISTGTPGGIFSSDNGLTIDANSGTIDLSTGVGNYNVIYTTQGTCPASSTQQVSITTSPTATFSYGSATYCPVGIDTVTFAANASGGVFSSTAGLSINSSTGEIDLLNSTPGTYTVSNDIAASGGCAAANATFDIEIFSLPVVTANASDVEICIGDSVLLTGSGANTYTWDNGVIDGDSVGPTVQTTYTVTGEDGNGCIDTNSVTIDVNALPNVVANASSSSVCSGGTVILTGSGADTYTWDNGVIDGDTVTITSNTTFNIVGTDINGCTNTDLVSISVNPSDDATFSFPNYCEGSPNGPTGVITIGGNFTFATPVFNGETINATTGEITGGVAGETYDIIYTTNGNCPNSSTTTVSVVSLADASFDMDSVCEGTAVLAKDVATNNGVFKFLSEPLDGATIDTISGTVTNGVRGTTYSVTYTVGDGACESTDTVQVYVDGVVAAFTPSPTSGESPLDVNFTNESEMAGTYLWEFGNGDTSSAVEPSYTYLDEGEFKVILYAYSDSLGCEDSVSFESIIVSNICNFFIPTAFVPAGKIENQNWVIECFDQYEGGNVIVYNRWGTKVYESVSGVDYVPWDGKGPGGSDLPVGSYFYVVSYEDGTHNGSVTIIR